MVKQSEIDIGFENESFYLDIDGDRVLKAKKLSEIIDKIEIELKDRYLHLSDGGKAKEGKKKKTSIGEYLGNVAHNWNKGNK